MAPERRTDNSVFIFNSIFTAMGLLLLAVITWIGTNVADIPVMKDRLSTLSNNVSAYVSQINELDKRVRKLEDKR